MNVMLPCNKPQWPASPRRSFASMRLAVSLLIQVLAASAAFAAWPMHVIDDKSKGPDGVKLADANGDGLLDIATGFEQGGVTRVFLHPGPAKVREPWPKVTVGKTPDAEDAVLVDLD